MYNNGFTPHMLFRWLVIIVVLSLIVHFIGLIGLIIATIALGLYLYVLPKRRKNRYRHHKSKRRLDI